MPLGLLSLHPSPLWPEAASQEEEPRKVVVPWPSSSGRAKYGRSKQTKSHLGVPHTRADKRSIGTRDKSFGGAILHSPALTCIGGWESLLSSSGICSLSIPVLENRLFQDNMRTSRVSQETTKIFQSLSPNSRSRRTTRSAARGISAFALGYDGGNEVKEQDESSEGDSKLSAAFSTDIEDVLSSSTHSRKRKRGDESSATTTVSTSTVVKSAWPSPRKQRVKEQDELSNPSASPNRAKAKPKIPARKTTAEDGTVAIHPPSHWDEVYGIIKRMRAENPTAPVDTMGCEDLFWQSAPPREKRYHTLTALMLSSQTKDTVTAAAMQRLHTELVPQAPPANGKIAESGLTVENVLSCDAKHLDNLIGKVGFHNNKTRYIKAAAEMLHNEYDGDIPGTVEGLMRLPGVGPKMAYLCMSAAWGIDVGIGVDVHVHRITNLWGWHKTKNPEETRYWLEGWLPKDRWHEINKMLVGLGQTVCLPIGRRCGECDLAGTGLCKAEIKGMKVKERRVKVEKAEPAPRRLKKKDEGTTEIKQELVDPSP